MYLIRCTNCVPDRVPSLDLLSAEPMPYKTQLGARFVYLMGHYMYVHNWDLSIPAIFSRLIRILPPDSFLHLNDWAGKELTFLEINNVFNI